MTPIDDFLVRPEDSVRTAMACIDRNAKGIALVVDEETHLIGTITDGDVRRAILAGIDPGDPVTSILARKPQEPHPKPVTALVGTPAAQLIHDMNRLSLRHVPLVDESGRVADVAVLTDLVKDYDLPLTAVVMAGGFGTRLRPLTDETPKPMLPLAGRPLLEHIIEQLRSCGIRRVNLTTHFRADVIADHFGDGEAFGVAIDYVNEDEPLGTAGALSLLEHSDQPLLVMNGDILTRVDFRAMLDFHREHQAAMTVAVRQEEFQLPFGVVTADGELVSRIEEKPVLRPFVNAGIYLLDPSARGHIPRGARFDMPELVDALVGEGLRVVSFPVREYWVDIGHADAYEQADNDLRAGKLER
jgi:dTDP-glucose pyrophosphorylase/CBS domain-containing protein